uniref:Uncharacterized protein n=1 Tax=Cucumis melo TaxID=3656 RepID=A0A9I9E9M7_CUCME
MTRPDSVRVGPVKIFLCLRRNFISSPLRRLFFTSSSAYSVGIFSSSASASASTLHLHLFATPSMNSFSIDETSNQSCSSPVLGKRKPSKHLDDMTEEIDGAEEIDEEFINIGKEMEAAFKNLNNDEVRFTSILTARIVLMQLLVNQVWDTLSDAAVSRKSGSCRKPIS